MTPERAKEPASRIAFVDYGKGFCIVLVVMMHSVLGLEAAVGHEGWLHAVVAFAKPFRIPSFFLIAGLFLSRSIDSDWRSYLDRKVLRAFGCGRASESFASQRAWLEVMRHAWPGWSVAWARDGIAAIRRHLALEEEVPGRDDAWGILDVLDPDDEDPDALGRAGCLLTVLEEDGTVRDHAISDGRPVHLLCGPQQIEALRAVRPLRYPDEIPDTADLAGGGLVHWPRREITYFSSLSVARVDVAIAGAWPGWAVAWEPRGTTGQIEASGRDPGPIEPSWRALIDSWLDALLAKRPDYTRGLKGQLWAWTAEGLDVTVDDRGLRDLAPAVSADERRLLRDELERRLRPGKTGEA